MVIRPFIVRLLCDQLLVILRILVITGSMLSSLHDEVALNHTLSILILLAACTNITGHDLCLCDPKHMHLVLLMLRPNPRPGRGGADFILPHVFRRCQKETNGSIFTRFSVPDQK